jgi:tetratricopeptide (TPR) repeat protein
VPFCARTKLPVFAFALAVTMLIGPAAAAQSSAPKARQAKQPTAPQLVLGPPTTVRTDVELDENPTLFAMLAALNMAGYNRGLHAAGASPYRKELRVRLAAEHLRIIERLRAYYHVHSKPDPAQNLAQYVSLALLLGDPPHFPLVRPVKQLPPDAAGVATFVPLLRRFYREASLAEEWQRYKPVYARAIQRYSEPVRRLTQRVDDYFRLPETYLGRQYIILPQFLAAPGDTQARDYLGNYYIMVGLNVSAHMPDIRHTYLHYVLDPLVEKFPDAYIRTAPLLRVVQRAPALNPEFKHNIRLFFTECLVRAVEARFIPFTGTAAQRQEQRRALIQRDMANGLILTQFFSRKLDAYAKSVVSFPQFYPEAAYSLRVSAWASRGRKMAFSPRPLGLPEPLQARPRVSLLQAGERALGAGDLAGAKALAQHALLQDHGDHATADFLLGEVAAQQGEPASAQANFERALALAAPSALHVRTWSNIYLGRLLDLEHHRRRALRHYRAALATASTREARALARAGINQPFTAGPPRPNSGGTGTHP